MSALGDDAVTLGAVAAARRLAGRDPFKKRYHVRPNYPQITRCSGGEITVGEKTYTCDVYIPVSGKTKKRDEAVTQGSSAAAHAVAAGELEIVCRGGPAILFVGAGKSSHLELTEEASRFLALRSIELEILPNAKAVEAYNKSKQRRAAIMHVMD